ncbi:MAG: flagellar protein FliT [Clostridium sp.]|jgi:hypothetical protein|uniref:flagellar protein FliT n=1 Tax=Clostridium sp. TaxID=1506 RepID=UPI0025BBDA89|nr:flagellar protein FliT [Clostridium sp.]MCH3964324.1 flagellar protein FliT [Clostridium sp.]MCI1715499.1 flagellar protein FliT [Clostridium sp.]MCI1799709.1 flagellar protein FliT [Clostridium sp.]MCI1813683.1 flagellar protein FliT [Clostridium sp.]MCI1870522.1 flagellar protein FliT [Clostridium sp.]
MKRTVENILMDYKNCTRDIIEILKKDDFDSLQNKMKTRQCILEKLISNKDKNQAREIYKKLNIREVESEAGRLLKEKASSIKEKLNNISRNKSASSAYGNIGSSAKIFSKKI